MDDSSIGGHDAEPLERLLGPAQQGIALAVPLELEIGVGLEGERRAELVHDHGMVDDELRREQGIHALRVAAHRLHGVAHRGKVHHGGHAGEILKQDAGRHERDLVLGSPLRVPASEPLDLRGAHGAAVFAPQQVLEQQLE